MLGLSRHIDLTKTHRFTLSIPPLLKLIIICTPYCFLSNCFVLRPLSMKGQFSLVIGRHGSAFVVILRDRGQRACGTHNRRNHCYYYYWECGIRCSVFVMRYAVTTPSRRLTISPSHRFTVPPGTTLPDWGQGLNSPECGASSRWRRYRIHSTRVLWAPRCIWSNGDVWKFALHSNSNYGSIDFPFFLFLRHHFLFLCCSLFPALLFSLSYFQLSFFVFFLVFFYCFLLVTCTS